MPELRIPEHSDRDDLGAFVARAVRLDGAAAVRLRARGGSVEAWVATPFDTLATRSVPGEVVPADLTLAGSDLLAALAVVGGAAVDPGHPQDLLWRSELPPERGWHAVDEVPAQVLAGLADRGAAVARDNPAPQGTPPASLLDQKVITVSGGGFEVPVPLRCLFALSGMGFVGEPGTEDAVRVSATDAWLRLDARYGAVARRRHSLLPLLV
ncbi:MAG: hypothetical protein ACRDRZ_16860 [Pseudonocardiaceae bacterium]